MEAIFRLGTLDKHVYGISLAEKTPGRNFFFADSALSVSPHLGNRISQRKLEALETVDSS